ncbi:MAG TPA: hypothetical protein GX498_02690 [Clostridiales bacterium]|nr:hypothetical protein [Clostridiales bacterium]
MLVADNRAYDYSYEEYITDVPLLDEEAKPKTKKVSKTKNKVRIFPIVLVFSLSILMISRYAYIAEINFTINKMEKEYNELLKKNENLKVNLMSTINLQTLEQIAMEELNMQYPDPDQILYVSAAKPIVIDKGYDDTYYSKEDVEENKYITKAKLLINSFISLLD